MPRIPAGGPKRMPSTEPKAKVNAKAPTQVEPEAKAKAPTQTEQIPPPLVPTTPDAWFDRLLVTLTQIAATDADIEGEVISELAEVRVPGDLMRLGLPAANIVRDLLKNERDARAAYT